MIKLMFITNNSDIARYAVQCGVDRIFVDLEIMGKIERQGHLNTVISQHSIADVFAVREAVSDAELLVRINPVHPESEWEIESVLEAKPELIMLPMFRTYEEVEKVCKIVNGRAGVIPLFETPQSVMRISEILKIEGIVEAFIGLNDLHLALGLDFMFELLSSGFVEYVTDKAKASGIPFGFGGIAKIGEGTVSADLVLAEHLRLGSGSVILSRTFHQNAKSYEELRRNIDLEQEIQKIRQLERSLANRSEQEIQADREKLSSTIQDILLRR